MAKRMTVKQLMELLEDYPEEAEVRLAQQPSWPFEYRVGEIVETTDAEGKTIVYIGEGRQLDYLPGAARDKLGWGR